MRRPLFLLLVAAACGRDAPEAPPRQATAPAAEILSDDWNVVRMFGQEVGYAHTRATRTSDVTETVVEVRMVLKRAGTEMAVEQTDASEERADGTLARIRSKRKMSTVETAADVRFENGKATLLVTVMGKTRKSTIDVPADTLGPRRIDEMTRAAKPGEKFEVKTFLADLPLPVTLTVTRGAAEEVELPDGRKERLHRVETVMSGLPIKTISWLDANGKARRTLIPVGGFEMETWLVTEERAKRALGGASAPEVFAPTLLRTPHRIPRPRHLDRATYRVRAKGEMPAFADDRQSVEEAGEKTVLLTIERKVPPEGHAGRRPIESPPRDLASSLEANSMVQSDEPEILAVAREVVGDESDPWKAARKLERWVKANIRGKSLDIGFASAAEVMRDRQGDCTEHAVLLCALCRAAGIPARCAMGIVCIGSAFGGHAWNEVWIDGKWYGLDATLGQGSVDPTHITLTRATLKDAGFAAEFLGLVQGLGSLEIDATEVVLEGRTIKIGESAPRIEGDRFEDPIYAIRFRCPEGFRLTPPREPGGMTAPLAEVRGKGVIRVAVIDTSADDWEEIRQSLGAGEDERVKGRPARRLARASGPCVYVLGPKGLFVFEADREADPAALDALLSSIEFDAG